MYKDEIINHYIKKYDFKKYLEIGVFGGGCISKINCLHKDGVDPGIEDLLSPFVNYEMTSDEFFNKLDENTEKYDIVLIDGLHHSEQVDKDIENVLNMPAIKK